jgi:hypothetical protein
MLPQRLTKIAIGLITLLSLITFGKRAFAFDLKEAVEDSVSVVLAYTTHLFLHELGHQLVADEVGAEATQMDFFKFKNGNFYPGLSTYKNMPNESKLPYAAAGERMAGFTFEYAFESYRNTPTAFNKALLFFSGADFLLYTVLGNYVFPDNKMYDPNIIREESGCSKEALLGIVLAKSLINTYRVVNKEVNFIPQLNMNRSSASLSIRINF